MTDSLNPAVQIFQPGDVALAFKEERLGTLLGSCVAVILTDPRIMVGATYHIVHAGNPPASNWGDTAFAAYAMQEMFTRLRNIGITPELCQAFVFGGGHMFTDLFSAKHVGATNIEWVEGFIQAHGIEVVVGSTGGNCYRMISWTVGLDAIYVERAGEAVDDEQHKGF